ncbi:transferase [Hesseltinella vesiculosa]|uniref:Transferase n=1 Tax=Hesseltinella vesiculosa TaxID=101127 RepID=A0A1X2GMJ8_9FUNG|nr:transferase [Hesseltinella vesiculosa]
MAPLPRIHLTRREWIKPATVTSEDKRRMALSDWDVVMYKSYTPLLLFYPNTNNAEGFMNTAMLLDSLRHVLNDFYPLAGRLVDVGNGRDEIECNDAGVLFQETTYQEELNTFVEDGYLPHQLDYHHMFPIHFYCSNQDPLLGIQVNRFLDGGVALGVMILHKIADAYSACLFLDAWAKQARGVAFAKGVFKRTLLAFPSNTVITDEAISHYREEHRAFNPKHHRLRMDPNQQKFSRTSPNGPLPLKSIVLEFHSDGLHQCKKDAHTQQMIDNKIWLSTKDALFGMLFRAIVRSRKVGPDQPVRFLFGINGRSKLKNVKDMDFYFGNWIITRSVTTSRKEVSETTVVEAALAFRQQINTLRSSLFHSISKIYTMNEDMTVHYLTYQPNSDTQFTASDASMLPFWRLDFGFGRPDRTRGYITSGGNGCMIMFGRSDNAKNAMYDVQIQMDADCIKRFIEDPEVQKYANRILY